MGAYWPGQLPLLVQSTTLGFLSLDLVLVMSVSEHIILVYLSDEKKFNMDSGVQRKMHY